MKGNGTAFFEKTFITQGMQDLITEALRAWLAPHLKLSFTLNRQWVAARRTCLLASACLPSTQRCARSIVLECQAPQLWVRLKSLRLTAATILIISSGVRLPANLGGRPVQRFWTSGPKAPDEKDWLNLFDGDQPVLILLDEMPPYFHYLDTQKVGNGTVADIATRAFAICSLPREEEERVRVVSDLAAAYDSGARLINKALEDARAEVGRQERIITPVDLAANEVYDILRKRLFKSLPTRPRLVILQRSLAEARRGRQIEDR